MSRKGFTLVELLAVLVLLSVIMLVAFPSILGAFKSTDTKINENTKELLKANAKSYVNDNPSEQSKGCVSIAKLISENYTQDPIANVKEEVSNDIKAHWIIKYKCEKGRCKDFEVVSSGECS